MEAITYETLREFVASDGVGVRSRTVLEPLGGPGDKVFPPTYGVDKGAETKYAVEVRRVGGEDVDSVLLDSVASQANRFELALLEAVRRSELCLPLISVDFRQHEGVRDLDLLSCLETPHRVYDAVLRDSLLGDKLFRLSDVGRAITEATTKNAAALFYYSPTTLLLGGWDSTGPKGGRGSKFERVMTSEVVGIGISRGVKTGSRIDPLAIEKGAGPVYDSADGSWTFDEAEAVKNDKGKTEPKDPSHINHGNIPPLIDPQSGGVTADEIVAVTVLSFAALRRLRFPLDHLGSAFDTAVRRDVEAAARSALAALGLAATVLAFEDGFDLRSRCVLAPTGPLEFEVLRRSGAEPTRFMLDHGQALALVDEASSAVAALGLPWMTDELFLQPADRLVDLVVRSRNLSEASSEQSEEE